MGFLAKAAFTDILKITAWKQVREFLPISMVRNSSTTSQQQ